MKKNHLLTKALATAIAVSISAAPVYAAEYTSDGSATCVVTANVGSSYTVSVPAVLNLSGSGNAFSGTYTVGAKGNIANDKKVVVAPAASTFEMAGTINSLNTATASVRQDKTDFVNTEVDAEDIVIGADDFAETTGTVNVTLDKADSYTGNLSFAFSLKDLNA